MAKPTGYYTSTAEHIETYILTHNQAVSLIVHHAKNLKGKGRIPKELLDSKLESKGVIMWATQFLEN